MQKTNPQFAASVFIDGEAGTTGIEIRERLAAVAEIEVKSIAPEKRKDAAARKAMMAEADLVVLCLPDDAAKEAVALASELGDDAPRIIDASTAHRVAPGWIYGFAEMDAGQAKAIAAARHVTNPGCYPTGAIALIRPLVDAGLIAPDHPITVNAVSGYSGGGKIDDRGLRGRQGARVRAVRPRLSSTSMCRSCSFTPSWRGGRSSCRRSAISAKACWFPSRCIWMLFQDKPTARQLEAALVEHYADAKFVKVVPAADPSAKGGRLEAEALNGTNLLELRVFANEAHRQAVLVAKLDNLGKGASGAAVQNIGVMLGIDTGSV